MAFSFDKLRSEIETLQSVEGTTMADLLSISAELRSITNMITRSGGMSLPELVFELDMRPSEAQMLLDALVDKGYLKSIEAKGEPRYNIAMARRRGYEVPSALWDVSDSETG